MNIEKIFLKTYLYEYMSLENMRLISIKKDQVVADDKKRKLKPIEDFLQKLVDFGVVVYNNSKFLQEDIDAIVKKEPFSYTYIDSSKSWSPGFSLYFEHPAQVEIAIPNSFDEGAVIIKVSSEHPDAYLLDHSFPSIVSACEALGKFLSKNTVEIMVDPQKYLQKVRGGETFDFSVERQVVENQKNIVKNSGSKPALSQNNQNSKPTNRIKISGNNGGDRIVPSRSLRDVESFLTKGDADENDGD